MVPRHKDIQNPSLVSTNDLYLALPPTPRSQSVGRHAIERYLTRVLPAFNGERRTMLMWAIGEALANAVEHSGSQVWVEINASIGNGWITVRISDRGRGFWVQRPTLPPPESIRGRGLILMERCVDEVQVESSPLFGTSVTLRQQYGISTTLPT